MKIKFTPAGKEEFRESVKFYEDRQKGLGKRFSESVRKTVYFVADNPQAAEIKYLTVRVTTVKKFPFTIHYSIKTNMILILAIFHNSRNPRR